MLLDDTPVAQALALVWPGLVLEQVDSIASTNTELMRRVRGGQTRPTLLLARQQTAGRGRLGRQWLSAAGAGAEAESLTFSLSLPLAPLDWAGLSLAVGVSLAASLHPALRLKWPNDLWLDGRKLGGILIETAALVGQRQVIVGVGLNLGRRDGAGLLVQRPQLAAVKVQAERRPDLRAEVLAEPQEIDAAPRRLESPAQDLELDV